MLSRTNLSLFGNAMSLRREETPFRFERDLRPVLFRVLDVLWLGRESLEKVRDPFVRSFGSLEAAESYAEEMEDLPGRHWGELVGGLPVNEHMGL